MAEDCVPETEVEFAVLRNRIRDAETEEERRHLQAELQKLEQLRSKAKDAMRKIVKQVTGESDEVVQRYMAGDFPLPQLTDEQDDSYSKAIGRFSEKCANIMEHSFLMGQLGPLIHLCARYPGSTVLDAIDAAGRLDA